MSQYPVYPQDRSDTASMSKIFHGFLLIVLVAQLACSGGSSAMETTTQTAPAETPELTASSGPIVTPTQPPTEADDQPPTGTTPSTTIPTTIPTGGGTTSTPPVEPANVDREALVALYEATSGPDWNNNENWLSSARIGEWYGVTTDANGRVTGLDFGGNNLTGELPPELGNLTSLVTLSIVNDRSLGGKIPSELGNLTSLEVLELIYNDVGGQIPPELGNLTSLKELTIRKNKLIGKIPSELGGLANLEKLDLYVNLLSGPIPPELGHLTNLRELNLGYNHLRGEIPSELGHLANLEELYIRQSELTGEVPVELGNLASLRVMDLGGNQLSGPIPPDLGRLGNLEELDIVANQLNGPIPSGLGDLVKVQSVKLDGNYLSGEIPPELGDLDRLVELGLTGNQLSGCIPISLRLQYYLAEELSLEFCEPSPVHTADAGGKDQADFLGPNTEYIDPVLVGLLYDQRANKATADTVRLAIWYNPEISTGVPLDVYIKEGGGVSEGEYIWSMPIGLVPSVVCRPDVLFAALAETDGTLSSEHRESPHPNLEEALINVVVAHQGGMPENQAALYAFAVKGKTVAVDVQVPDAETGDGIRAWLSQRNIYAPPNRDGSLHVVVLLPVSQIQLLAEQFPNTYLDAMTVEGQGLPMLRLQWPPETLHFEKAITQKFLNPDSDEGRAGVGNGLAPCSSVAEGS